MRNPGGIKPEHCRPALSPESRRSEVLWLGESLPRETRSLCGEPCANFESARVDLHHFREKAVTIRIAKTGRFNVSRIYVMNEDRALANSRELRVPDEEKRLQQLLEQNLPSSWTRSTREKRSVVADKARNAGGKLSFGIYRVVHRVPSCRPVRRSDTRRVEAAIILGRPVKPFGRCSIRG